MTRLREREYTYFTTVRSWCGACNSPVPARVFLQKGEVYQQSLCPRCNPRPSLIAASQDWYLKQTLQRFPVREATPGARVPQQGCPQDCGPCTWHAATCESVQISPATPKDATRDVDLLIAKFGKIGLLEIAGMCSPAIVDACRQSQISTLRFRASGKESTRELRDLGVEITVSLDATAPSHIEELLACGVRVAIDCAVVSARAALELVAKHDGITYVSIAVAPGMAIDEAARRIAEITSEALRPGAEHPLCCLHSEWKGRPLRVHAEMHDGNFDCTRAMLCPHWRLFSPENLAPACMQRLFREVHR